jgi:hypothetical protein
LLVNAESSSGSANTERASTGGDDEKGSMVIGGDVGSVTTAESWRCANSPNIPPRAADARSALTGDADPSLHVKSPSPLV